MDFRAALSGVVVVRRLVREGWKTLSPGKTASPTAMTYPRKLLPGG